MQELYNEEVRCIMTFISQEKVISHESIAENRRGRYFQDSDKKECQINNKINGTPQGCLLAHFEAIFDLNRSEFTCT